MHLNFFKFFFILFIYDSYRERERGRDTGRGSCGPCGGDAVVGCPPPPVARSSQLGPSLGTGVHSRELPGPFRVTSLALGEIAHSHGRLRRECKAWPPCLGQLWRTIPVSELPVQLATTILGFNLSPHWSSFLLFPHQIHSSFSLHTFCVSGSGTSTHQWLRYPKSSPWILLSVTRDSESYCLPLLNTSPNWSLITHLCCYPFICTITFLPPPQPSHCHPCRTTQWPEQTFPM